MFASPEVTVSSKSIQITTIRLKKDAVTTTENSASANKTTAWCAYCNKTCHTCDSCWKLHEVEPRRFSQEQISYVQKLLKPKYESFSALNGFVAQSGSNPNVFSCFYPSNSTPWIIDSGASNHMTNLPHLFGCN